MSSWSQVGDLPTCQLHEFILYMRKNYCSRVQNATCQMTFIIYRRRDEIEMAKRFERKPQVSRDVVDKRPQSSAEKQPRLHLLVWNARHFIV